MSGGRWRYQSNHLEDLASELELKTNELVELIKAVARAEHIVDWAESGDTVRRREDGSGAEHDLYELWLATFSKIYDESLATLTIIPGLCWSRRVSEGNLPLKISLALV